MSSGAAGPPFTIGAELVFETASVNGTTLHDMRGGE